MFRTGSNLFLKESVVIHCLYTIILINFTNWNTNRYYVIRLMTTLNILIGCPVLFFNVAPENTFVNYYPFWFKIFIELFIIELFFTIERILFEELQNVLTGLYVCLIDIKWSIILTILTLRVRKQKTKSLWLHIYLKIELLKWNIIIVFRGE